MIEIPNILNFQVKQALSVLILQNIVTVVKNKKGFFEYKIHPKAILRRVRFAKYIKLARTLYGETAELLVSGTSCNFYYVLVKVSITSVFF